MTKHNFLGHFYYKNYLRNTTLFEVHYPPCSNRDYIHFSWRVKSLQKVAIILDVYGYIGIYNLLRSLNLYK